MCDEEKESAVIKTEANPMTLMADNYNIKPGKLLSVLKNTVIKNATDEELMAFVMVAQQYDLNPLTKEIYAFPSNGKVVPIIGVDGWVNLVNRQKMFDGVWFDEVVGDHGKPVSTTCHMAVKGREHPVSVTEWFDECYRPTEPWKKMPKRMLRHKAYMQAARVAFGLSGLYDEDEAHDIVYGYSDNPRTMLPDRTIIESEDAAATPKIVSLSDLAPQDEQPPASEPTPAPGPEDVVDDGSPEFGNPGDFDVDAMMNQATPTTK